MKGRILACFLLVFCLLAGCGDHYPEGTVKVHKDLTVILPGDFIELTNGENADFLYGRNTLVVKGLAESKEQLKQMSLKEYSEAVAKQKNATPTPSGDGYVFTYEAAVGDTEYAYTVATYEGPENFWILQFYCPKENLAENQPEINIILEGIQPKIS